MTARNCTPAAARCRPPCVPTATPDGRPVWTPLVAISLLIWFVLAMQCMSTMAVARRETGGWGWPLFMLLYMNALAYGVCLIVYQVGRLV